MAVMSLFLVASGVSNLLKINFTQELDTMANQTVLVYNINREDLTLNWDGGMVNGTIDAVPIRFYLNRDILNSNSGVFADDNNLIINSNCKTLQIKIDLTIAKINNNLVDIHFDDDYNPLNIIKELKCI